MPIWKAFLSKVNKPKPREDLGLCGVGKIKKKGRENRSREGNERGEQGRKKV
jgi:hypothetical protein